MKLTNWKTTLAAVATLISIAAKVINGGHLDWATDGPMITAALGLLAAKDHDVSGGRVKQ